MHQPVTIVTVVIFTATLNHVKHRDIVKYSLLYSPRYYFTFDVVKEAAAFYPL